MGGWKGRLHLPAFPGQGLCCSVDSGPHYAAVRASGRPETQPAWLLGLPNLYLTLGTAMEQAGQSYRLASLPHLGP